MIKHIFILWLITASFSVFAQPESGKKQKKPFQIDWNAPTACSDFKHKYPTTKIHRDDDLEELQVKLPEKYFPDSDMIQVICVPTEIISIHVRIPKTREDGVDLAALYEQLDNAYDLDLIQPKIENGAIKSTFRAGTIRINLNDEINSKYRSVTFFVR